MTSVWADRCQQLTQREEGEYNVFMIFKSSQIIGITEIIPSKRRLGFEC